MRRGIGFLLFVFLLLGATLPLRLALGWFDAGAVLSAARVEGTVWDGMLHDARLHGLSVGDVALALDVPSLFTGRLALRFAADGTGGLMRRGPDGVWGMEDRGAAAPAL